MKNALYLAIVFVFSTALPAWSAPVIDFETTPAGGTPTDDGALSPGTPYTIGTVQVRFGFDYNSDTIIDANAEFERVGTFPGELPNIGFLGSTGHDAPDPNAAAQMDSWFIRPPVGGTDFGLFIIDYVSTAGPVTAASGEIWDIDGNPNQTPPVTEQYVVRAYDAASNLLATQISPLGVIDTPTAPLDGQPWAFNFVGLTAGINRIIIDFTGSKTNGIGLAFDNFYPQNAIPEPATAVGLGMGLIVLALRRRRRLTNVTTHGNIYQ